MSSVKEDHSGWCEFTQRCVGKAFSLVELLIVVAIVGILAALSTVAFNTVGSGSAISTGGALLESQIVLALRHAAAKNETVQVRIYPDLRPPRISLVVSDEHLDRGVAMPRGVVIDGSGQFSSILGPDVTSGTEIGDAPPILRGQAYRQFEIRASGRNDLPLSGEPWTLTLKGENAPARGSAPADNFVTLVIDPITSAVRTFQP